jgi:hypothetical protein
MKREFALSELRNLVGGSSFSWNWTASQVHSQGTLIGIRQGDLDVVEMDEGKFFSSVKIRNNEDAFCWEIINVYGPVKQELKGHFLQELYRKIKSADIHLLVGVTLI